MQQLEKTRKSLVKVVLEVLLEFDELSGPELVEVFLPLSNHLRVVLLKTFYKINCQKASSQFIGIRIVVIVPLEILHLF